MELFQVFWDEQKRLFLEFKKDDKEKLIYQPEKIKYINLQFEISRTFKENLYHKEPPILISIKKIYHRSEFLSFYVDLDELRIADNVQIIILRLIIYLHIGHKFEYSFREKFKLCDIEINEDCYYGYDFEDLDLNNGFKTSLTQEKVYEEIKKDLKNSTEKKTRILEKRKVENIRENSDLISMMCESNKSLKIIADELKNLTSTIKNLSFNSIPQSYMTQTPVVVNNGGTGIERIKSPPSKSNLIQDSGSSAKLLVIKEMKSIFQKNIEKNMDFNVKDILKPMSDEEIKSMTLSDEDLENKEKQAIKNQIKRLKKQQSKKITLDKLKKPK